MLVTLIYLAVQVRQVKQAVRNAAFDETAHSWRETLGLLTNDFDLFLRGAGAHGSARQLSGQEALKFWMMMNQVFAYFENFHAKYRAGIVDQAEWERLNRVMVFYLAWPGMTEWWERNQGMYTEAFAGHVGHTLGGLRNGTIERPDLEPYLQEVGA